MTKKKSEKTEGVNLDDAFADDEDVEYTKSKPRKLESKEKAEETKEATNHVIKQSKPIEKIKKGDKITIDNKTYEVDAHYMLMDHKTTKEMTIEIFNDKDEDFQLRYFSDNMQETLQFYKLQQIIYTPTNFGKIEW